MYRKQSLRWKRLRDNDRYEISETGVVRVREGIRNEGFVLMPFWDRPSPYIELWRGSCHTRRVLWRLMERHWPGKPYPKEWLPGNRGKQ